MKKVVLLILVASSLIGFANCGKVKERRMEDKLTYKAWTIYKVEQEGIDITSTNNYVATYSFYRDGSYIIDDNQIISTGFNLGSWSLSGSILTLTNNGTWDIKTLTDTELKLKSLDFDFVVYFN